MKSTITYKGLPEYAEFYGSLNYVYGLSDFWAYIFQDKELLDRTLEAQSYLYSEIYSRFLQLTSSISLEDIQTSFHSSLKLLIIEQPLDDRGNEVETLHDAGIFSYTYPLPYTILNSKYLMDRPMVAKRTYEKDVHYNIILGGKVLELFKPISEMGFPVKRVSREGKEYNQYALWITDVFVDENLVWDYFGKFVSVSPSTSTDLYRDFIRGLYFLYSSGPTVELLGRGLNLAIGIPFARDTEEVLEVVLDPESGNYNVVTATNSYTIPYGIPSDYVPGELVAVNEPLVNVADIRDYRTDDDWWLNVSIPRKLFKGYDTNLPTIATAGSNIEYYMREYLKYHTFLVNVKVVASFTAESMGEVVNLIEQAKPSYTLPVFVWAVPLPEEFFVGSDEDFVMQPGLSLQEVMFYGEYIKRFKNIPKERSTTAWIRSNGDLTGYLGVTVDAEHTVNSAPLLDVVIEVPESELVPLYNTTTTELLNMMAILGITITAGQLPDRFVIDNVNATLHYSTIIMREAGAPAGIGYNNGDLDPYYGEAKRRFVPAIGDLTTTETLAFLRISPGLYSVFLRQVGGNTLFTPTYFPPAEDDPLEVTTTFVVISCAYPLDATDAEITSTIGGDLGNARMVPDVDQQGGIFTVDGTWHDEYLAPVGISTGTMATMANNVGIKVMEFDVSIPTPTGSFTSVGCYFYINGVGNLLDWYIQANTDGTFETYFTSSGGMVTHYAASGIAIPITKVALWMNSVTNTLQIYLNGVAVTMGSATLPESGAFYPVLLASQSSGVTSVGQQIQIRMVTSAAEISGTYPVGSTDMCGNTL